MTAPGPFDEGRLVVGVGVRRVLRQREEEGEPVDGQTLGYQSPRTGVARAGTQTRYKTATSGRSAKAGAYVSTARSVSSDVSMLGELQRGPRIRKPTRSRGWSPHSNSVRRYG